MANSKMFSDGVIDLKVHYNYHGNQRCGLIDCNYGEMFGMRYIEFENMLRCEVPHLNRLAVMRISFMDDENTYIDLNERNYHRFLKLAVKAFTDDTPKVNLKIVEGSSPVIVEKSEAPRTTNSVGETPRSTSRRVLQYDSEEFVQTYRSPIEIDINLKKRELELKETEFGDVKAEYDSKYNDFHPSGIYGDQSKSVCSRCHLRLGHSRNRCHMGECESASQCGIVDKHPGEKKELQDITKKKQRLEAEIKSLKSDINAKEAASNEVKLSFESRVHDILIRSNPQKYLTEQRRPKEGIILADSYILKQYYGIKAKTIDKEALECEAGMFKTIIESYNEKMRVSKPKNCVVRQIEMGATWQQSISPNVYPYSATGWTPFFYMPSADMYHQPRIPAVASPPPPPPSPPGKSDTD